ncbi:MAG TPA: N-acetylmuramoyl-L-alanine amidase CwlD [Clostridia bacterium]|nr:N-acetylmuramoyl-L-alanine amidase CwlD [Clostridia bacterium]
MRVVFLVLHRRALCLIILSLLGLTLSALFVFYVNYGTADREAAGQETFNWVLGGKTIALDPGHGGYDPGAKGPGGSLEKDINLAIALQLQQVLEQAGVNVVLTRDRDVDLLTPGEGTKKYRDLSNRLKLIREQGAELLVSIHLNSSGSRWRGAQVFYHPKDPRNKELAVAIQAEIRNRLQNTTRQALPLTTAYLLKEIDIPAVIVEAGFISNPEEERLLNRVDYQEKMAQAIAGGILKYLSCVDE